MLATYHNKRKDHADEEEADPVYGACNHVGCRPCGLREQLHRQDISHTTYGEDNRDTRIRSSLYDLRVKTQVTQNADCYLALIQNSE